MAFADKHNVLAISILLYELVEAMFPHQGPCHRGDAACQCLAHLLAAIGVARLRDALENRNPASWARRVIRVLPPAWLAHAHGPDSPLVRAMKDICSNTATVNTSILGPAGASSTTYALFGHAGLYAGKANIKRMHKGGYSLRVYEHIRALRQSLGSVSMMPALAATTESQAYAIEATII